MESIGPKGIVGVVGRPYLALDSLLDLSRLEAVHDEVCLALAQSPTDYTGGSHRSMGIMPAGAEAEALTDYGEVIAAMDDACFETFRGLADDPSSIDPARRGGLRFGEERDIPLSRRQMLWLEYRHGVYFPWKVYLEMIPNLRWGDKSSREGKRFTRTALALLPRTVDFARSLPFEWIGRCNVMGLRAHDHGTVHRDGEPCEQRAPDEFITVVPGPEKRLYLLDEGTGERVPVRGRAYWFNDFDYHGVEASPFFRYSIRVDGRFTDEFRARLNAAFAEGTQ